MQLKPVLNIAINATRSAGKVINHGFPLYKDIKFQPKDFNDIVTDIDKAAEQTIINILSKAYPDHSILSEEAGYLQGDNPDYQWIIDPLDGTRNFINGIPYIAVSVALKVKGRIEIGVVHNPINGNIYTACRGKGAQLNNHRIRAYAPTAIKPTLVATEFIHDAVTAEKYYRIVCQLASRKFSIRQMGATALDIAQVAAGQFHGFFGLKLKSWDIAAGQLIAQEAGAIVTDTQGGDDYFTSGNLVVGPVQLVRSMLVNIRKVI